MEDLTDYQWLVSDAARAWLTEGAELPPHRLVERLRKWLSGDRARLVAGQVGLRAKAGEKFGPLAQDMFFTERALQQATDGEIAAYKAQRIHAGQIATPETVTDYCCGIGGDLLALAQGAPVVGLDRDPLMTLLAEANARAAGLAGQCSYVVAEAEAHPPVGTWHLDPDRRSEGRRSTRPEWHSPSEATVDVWLELAPRGALKLAPAAIISPEWETVGELEWISRARSCRQLVAWFGELAAAPGLRRATVLHHGQADSFLGDPQCNAPLATVVGEYVADTDPAIRAARLTGALAAALDCETLAPGETYLSSPVPLEHPLVSCFRVLNVLPMRVSNLAKHLRSLGIGELEIKTRGVAVSPEQLRKKLKLAGDREATLLITRQEKKEFAILAERVTGRN